MERLAPEDPPSLGEHVLVARLGAGGMGQVYLARTPAGLLVAIKMVHEHLAQDPRFRARFRREVAHAQAVSGAFTAPVLDADPEAATPWLATAYLPGLSLQEAVVSHGPFPLPTTLALAAGLAEGLESIHQAGVVHRDLKPSNVLLSGEGPRIIDFGIARAADDNVLTRPGGVMGSPGYMSPEQASGQEVGPAGDVFAFGAVLGFTATGKRVFGDGPIETMIHRVLHEEPDLDGVQDPFLHGLIADCMAKNPALRPTSALLLDRLSWAGAAPVGVGWLPPSLASAVQARQAQPPPSTMMLPARLRRRRLLIIGGLAGAVALSAALGELSAWQRGRTTPQRKEPEKAPSGALTTPAGSAGPKPADGRVVWRSRGLTSQAPPVIGGRTTFLATQSAVLTSPIGERLVVAVDLRSGDQRWRRKLRLSQETLSVAGDLILMGELGGELGEGRDKVTTVETAGGAERWSSPMNGSLAAAPIASGGTVFAAGTEPGADRGILAAFELRSGGEKWRRSVSWGRRDEETGPWLTAGGGLLYVLDEELRAFDAASGQDTWAYRVEHLAAAAAGDTVYVSDKSSRLHAVRDGRARWISKVGVVGKPPLVYAESVIVRDELGFVRALDAASGKQRWAVPIPATKAGDRTSAPLALAKGMLYVTGGGAVHAIDPVRARVRWTLALGSGSSPELRDDLTAAGGIVVCHTDGLVAVTGP